MPRRRTHTPDKILEAATRRFWRNGYAATSVDDLVQATGASRHALYEEFDAKRGLFSACLDHYRDHVVTPAFGRVERPDADLESIAAFFEYQIARAEAAGLPGSGCLFANTMTEVAPHDPKIAAQVRAHDARLAAGFRGALSNSASLGMALSPADLDDLAVFLVISAQGLWSMSRAVSDPGVLRRYAATLIALVRQAICATTRPTNDTTGV